MHSIPRFGAHVAMQLKEQSSLPAHCHFFLSLVFTLQRECGMPFRGIFTRGDKCRMSSRQVLSISCVSLFDNCMKLMVHSAGPYCTLTWIAMMRILLLTRARESMTKLNLQLLARVIWAQKGKHISTPSVLNKRVAQAPNTLQKLQKPCDGNSAKSQLHFPSWRREHLSGSIVLWKSQPNEFWAPNLSQPNLTCTVGALENDQPNVP